MSLLQRVQFLEAFSCLGDKCEDTCCKGWGMQIDAAMVEKYRQQAPELLDAVTSGEAEHIMRRDAETDYCVKFDNGWCGIHKKYGDAFLGDACHFFPRITRQIGTEIHQTASLSCPEVVRCILQAEAPFAAVNSETLRLPQEIKNYCDGSLSEADMLATHQTFLTAAESPDATAEHIACRLLIVAEALERIDKSSWPAAAAFYLKSADDRLPSTVSNKQDYFLLLQSLTGLIAATRKAARPRLEEIINTIHQAMALTRPQDPTLPYTVSQENFDRIQNMQRLWEQHSSFLQPKLKRWLQAQLSVAFFPFSGFGNTLSQRAAIIGIRLSLLKLALMAELQVHGSVSDDNFVRLIQSLARFLDHLADPTLSLHIYEETGWLKPSGLRSLLGDNLLGDK